MGDGTVLAFVAVNAFMGVSVGRRGGKAAWHPRERNGIASRPALSLSHWSGDRDIF